MNRQTRAVFRSLIRHGMAEKAARAVMADYDLERIRWHIAEYEKRKKGGKADGIGWLVEGIKVDYRPQSSIFEQEEEAKRKAAQRRRAITSGRFCSSACAVFFQRHLGPNPRFVVTSLRPHLKRVANGLALTLGSGLITIS